MEKDYFAHKTAIVEEGAIIGKETKIWHFCHIMPANNGAIGAKGSSLANSGRAILSPSVNCASWIYNICKDATWTKEDIIIAQETCVETYIVLYLAIISQHNIGSNKDILTYITSISHNCIGHNMAEMPYLGLLSNNCPLLHNGCIMHKIVLLHPNHIILYHLSRVQ